jgi:hypothetical protein
MHAVTEGGFADGPWRGTGRSIALREHALVLPLFVGLVALGVAGDLCGTGSASRMRS